MILFAFTLVTVFHIDNKEFFDTVAQQIDTHHWHQIKCREHNPELSALTIKTYNGKEIVCNKLVKD